MYLSCIFLNSLLLRVGLLIGWESIFSWEFEVCNPRTYNRGGAYNWDSKLFETLICKLAECSNWSGAKRPSSHKL